jgi:selenocysteine-specific elongation factor
MRVIGSAGHVDHGKSTLVYRLTNIDPDRLIEEKERQMTIDLGFAWMELPNQEIIGIIDVPGHRDFIENMLAGVGGIDAVLLVIAADEGVMPQTREHLAILDLLNIQKGLIVLSKIDLIDDPDWLALVEQDIRETLRNTTLAQAEIVRVSAHTGAGLPLLIDRLTGLLDTLPPNLDYNHPRLAIDRVFTVGGFGTVITGTLLGGTLRVGDEIEIQPSGLRSRIRGLQSYKQPVEIAQPGSRVAVNLTGVEKAAVRRGQVLAYPRQMQPTTLVDVYFRHLAEASRPLKHNTEIKLFVGAAETTAYVRLLNDEQLPPGQTGWLQLRLEKPLALANGDRFIIRYPSPGETIGGGVVVNPHPGRRWKRFHPDVITQLELRLAGTPAERTAQAANHTEPLNRQALQKQTGLGDNELDEALREALNTGLLVEPFSGAFMAAATWHLLQQRLETILTEYHRNEPLRRGIQREHLRSQLNVKQNLLSALLEANPKIIAEGTLLRLASHQIQFTTDQQARIKALQQMMQAAPYTPPSFTEAAQIVGEDVLLALIDQGELVRVQPEVIFTRPVYDEMTTGILNWIDQHGAITASELRDLFDTSRKYAIGMLEHLDAIKVTRRQGDARIRGARAQTPG